MVCLHCEHTANMYTTYKYKQHVSINKIQRRVETSANTSRNINLYWCAYIASTPRICTQHMYIYTICGYNIYLYSRHVFVYTTYILYTQYVFNMYICIGVSRLQIHAETLNLYRRAYIANTLQMCIYVFKLYKYINVSRVQIHV